MFAWGNRDRFVSRAAAELCGRYVTGPYRFTELDGASHWLPEQAADQVAALLAEHFAAPPILGAASSAHLRIKRLA